MNWTPRAKRQKVRSISFTTKQKQVGKLQKPIITLKKTLWNVDNILSSSSMPNVLVISVKPTSQRGWSPLTRFRRSWHNRIVSNTSITSELKNTIHQLPHTWKREKASDANGFIIFWGDSGILVKSSQPAECVSLGIEPVSSFDEASSMTTRSNTKETSCRTVAPAVFPIVASFAKWRRKHSTRH